MESKDSKPATDFIKEVSDNLKLNRLNTIKSMNIYEKLLAISIEIGLIPKDLEVSTGKGSYKAVGEGNVLKAVKPLECKYRVYSYPIGRKIVDNGNIESTNYKGETKSQLYLRIETTYRFVNLDKPEEFVDMVSYGDGIDSGDKACGKAMTYSDKYALMKAYKMITGDDPDQEGSPASVKLEDVGDVPILFTAPWELLPTKGQLAEAKELKINLNTLASYLGKNIRDLTSDDLDYAINAKRMKK